MKRVFLEFANLIMVYTWVVSGNPQLSVLMHVVSSLFLLMEKFHMQALILSLILTLESLPLLFIKEKNYLNIGNN